MMADWGKSSRDTQGLSLGTRLICVAMLLYIAAVVAARSTGPFNDFTSWFLYAQDRWLLLIQLGVFLIVVWRLRPAASPIALSKRACIALALLVIPFCYLGHWLVLSGYDLSRDEQMASFDARIFAHGHIVQSVAPPWRKHLAALNTMFILPAAKPIAWVSGYLPINAVFRALVGMVGDQALTGPVMTGVGAFASWKCAQRLWPDDREAATLTLLFYLASGQVLAAGMSAFAMAGHLALNMLWLWLFLMDRRRSDVAALAIGVLATGLHQPLFHPLFVAPFILLLITRRAWGRATLFALSYLAIGLFWLSWPNLIYAMIEVGHPAVKPEGADFWSRLIWALTTGAAPRGIYMSANLLRFAAWQPILLLPLFAIGLATARRNGMALALAAAAILPVIAMTILLPDQGQGFGYRYVHGVIGALVLVAVYGWRDVAQRNASWRALTVRCLAGSALLLLPAQLVMTHAYYSSFAAVDRRIAASGTDYFIVGNDDAPLSNTFVINQADLLQRPLRLFADRIDPELMHFMCSKNAIVGMPTSALYAPVNHYFSGGIVSLSSDRRVKKLGPQLVAAGCQIVVVGSPA